MAPLRHAQGLVFAVQKELGEPDGLDGIVGAGRYAALSRLRDGGLRSDGVR